MNATATGNNFAEYFIQNFSLPKPIINYVLTNPSSSNVYEKLIKMCKYFFAKNSILLIDTVIAETPQNWKLLYFNNSARRRFNSSLIRGKLWIINKIIALPGMTDADAIEHGTFASIISSKIFKCTIYHLSLNLQTITFAEFLLFAPNVKFCKFNKVTVIYPDGSHVSFEVIVKNLPNIENLQYHFTTNISNVSSKTVKELFKMPQFVNLISLKLFGIPEEFDVETFSEFEKWFTPKGSEPVNAGSPRIHICVRRNNTSEAFQKRVVRAFTICRHQNLHFAYNLF